MLVTLKIFLVSYLKQVIKCLVVVKRGGFLTEKRMKYFTYDFKKATIPFTWDP